MTAVQSKLSRAKVVQSKSHVPEDSTDQVRKAFKAQDAAFRGALLDAIEAGLEKIPIVHENPLEGLPKRFTPLSTVSQCSTSSGWEFLPNRDTGGGSHKRIRRAPITLPSKVTLP